MKRNLLFALFALLVGVGIVKADNININVDHADNVEVSVNNGETILALQDGMNRITEYTSDNNPLMIRAANGASIVSVTKNNNTVLNPNGGGFYTMAIEAMMLDIITEGGSTVDPGEQTVKVWFDLTGIAGSATITQGGEAVAFSNSVYTVIKSGEPCVIAAAEGYKITNVEGSYATIEEQADGTWTYTTTHNMTYVNVTTEALPIAGIKFKVVSDYMPNLSIVAGRPAEQGDEYQWVPIAADGSAVLPEGWDFINFKGEDGASIVSIKRNDTDLVHSDWVGWRSYVEEGDVFEVVTSGPEKEVTFYANSYRNGVGLEYFNFESDGKFFELSGESATATLRRGANVTVTGKGANICDWVMCGSNYMENAPFTFNLGDNNLISVSGTAVGGVHIDVTDASAIVVKQLNGRGDVLDLVDGENTFALADLENNLSIKPAEGCEIRSVIVNQQPVSISGSGDYSIAAAEGMLIEINARHIPTEVPFTIVLLDSSSDDAPDATLCEGLDFYIDGQAAQLDESTTTIMVPYQKTVTFSPRYGYVIDSVEAGNNFTQVADGVNYTVFATEPCALTIHMRKIVAPEGYALVYFQTNDTNHVSFLPFDADKERLPGSFNTTQPGVIKIGDYVCVKKFSFDLLFKSITVDGTPIKIDDEQEAFQEYYIKIEGDCTINALIYDPNEGTVSITCWNTDDSVFGLLISDIYVNDNGNLVQHYNAVPGETVELVVPYVAPGHQLVAVAGKSATSPTFTDEADLTHVKFTVPEGVINPATGDPYFYIFQPLCEVDTDNPPFLLEFYPTYVEENGLQEVCGYLVGVEPYGNKEAIMMFATEGTEVDILAYERDDYQFITMWAMHGDINSTDVYRREISSPYTVDPADAWELQGHSKINLIGEFKKRDTALADVAVETPLTFDAAAATLEGAGEIKVFDAAGILVASGRDTLGVAHLSSGLYIAVAGNQTLKFVKK